MIFFVLFFRFFSLKLAALCVFICEIGWYGRSACSQTHLVGGGGTFAVAAVFCQLFFFFFCSTIFKHICLFLSLSACISRVSFFWSVHIFLSTWIKRTQNKPKTQNQLDSSYIPFCRILCFAFNFRHNLFTVCTLDIGFIPLYIQCIFPHTFRAFFFVCLESFLCMFFTHNDWYQIHEYNWNVFCFLSFAFKLKRKKTKLLSTIHHYAQNEPNESRINTHTIVLFKSIWMFRSKCFWWW